MGVVIWVAGLIIFFGRVGEWGSGVAVVGSLVAVLATYLGDKAVDPNVYRFKNSPTRTATGGAAVSGDYDDKRTVTVLGITLGILGLIISVHGILAILIYH